MSAPEVRIEQGAHTWIWRAECTACGAFRVLVNVEHRDEWMRAHEATCPAIQLARLQACWDARDEALRALIENWESTARVLSARYDDTGERELRGRSKALRIAADELERAIGGGE